MSYSPNRIRGPRNIRFERKGCWDRPRTPRVRERKEVIRMSRVMTMELAMRSVYCAIDETEASFRRMRFWNRPLTRKQMLEELSNVLSCLGAARDEVERIPE